MSVKSAVQGRWITNSTVRLERIDSVEAYWLAPSFVRLRHGFSTKVRLAIQLSRRQCDWDRKFVPIKLIKLECWRTERNRFPQLRMGLGYPKIQLHVHTPTGDIGLGGRQKNEMTPRPRKSQLEVQVPDRPGSFLIELTRLSLEKWADQFAKNEKVGTDLKSGITNTLSCDHR